MSKIETGKTDIPLKRLFSIAEALGIAVELLFVDPFLIIQKNQNNNTLTWSFPNNVTLNSIRDFDSYQPKELKKGI